MYNTTDTSDVAHSRIETCNRRNQAAADTHLRTRGNQDRAQNIMRVVKLKGKRWVGHVVYMVKMGNIHNILHN
jgi:IS4 transposase